MRIAVAGARSTRQHSTMTTTSDIITQLPLPDIDAVSFYERDEITTDLICCYVAIAGRIWTFHEEQKGWDELIAHLARLPGFRADWYEVVVQPPFAESQTIAFDRR